MKDGYVWGRGSKDDKPVLTANLITMLALKRSGVTLDRDVIVVRTQPGTKLSAAGHANVSFEVDDIDRRTRSGWSVLVRGLAEEVTSAHGAEMVERTRASGVQPWATGEHGRWMRIIPQGISGRRIVPGELPPPFEPGSYF